MPAGPDRRQTIHATAIALNGRAALICGPSGSGKSDLALRCIGMAPSALITHQVLLIADDYVVLEPQVGGGVHLTAPTSTVGLLEVRGLGLLTLPSAPRATLALVVDLVPDSEPIDRMPEPRSVDIAGREVARIALHPFEASSPLKLLLALSSAA